MACCSAHRLVSVQAQSLPSVTAAPVSLSTQDSETPRIPVIRCPMLMSLARTQHSLWLYEPCSPPIWALGFLSPHRRDNRSKKGALFKSVTDRFHSLAAGYELAFVVIHAVGEVDVPCSSVLVG